MLGRKGRPSRPWWGLAGAKQEGSEGPLEGWYVASLIAGSPRAP